MTDIAFLVGGLLLLILGGELLVRGAATTAERLGMSPLLIGLTLVGFGTSTPELVTSVEAALSGLPGIAIGNIVGSNVANILLILGVCALITPVAVRRDALRRDGGVMLGATAAFVAVGFIAPLDRLVGALFLAALVGYLYYAYRTESAGATAGHTAAFEKLEAHEELFEPDGTVAAESAYAGAGPIPPKPNGAVLAPLAMAFGGLLIVVLGGKLLVEGAAGIARSAGVSDSVIGLTIVAIGTSLPELVASVIAALRKHADVALGNVLGSNIYNVFGIGGVTAVISPTVIPAEIVAFDNWIMLGVSAMMLLFAYTGRRISRGEAALMVALYAGFIAIQVV